MKSRIVFSSFCLCLILSVNASAAIVLRGEQQTLLEPTVAAGNYTLDVTIESINNVEDVQALQFEMDFNDPNITFLEWTEVTTSQLPFDGAGSVAGFRGIGMTNLIGPLIADLPIGIPTVLGRVTFNVAAPAQSVAIPIGGAIEFRDPTNTLIPFTVGSGLSVTAIPEPSLSGLLGLTGLAAMSRRGRRRL